MRAASERMGSASGHPGAIAIVERLCLGDKAELSGALPC